MKDGKKPLGIVENTDFEKAIQAIDDLKGEGKTEELELVFSHLVGQIGHAKYVEDLMLEAFNIGNNVFEKLDWQFDYNGICAKVSLKIFDELKKERDDSRDPNGSHD